MSTSPAVSVVLTTYNQAKWLRESVDSVIGQTFPDWELLLVDNGSTDETPQLLDEYRKRNDPRIIIKRYDQNLHNTTISNTAFREARGKYICLLYGDDYFLPTKLEKQFRFIETLSDEYGLVYCDAYKHIDATGELIPHQMPRMRGYVLEQLLQSPPQIWTIAPMIRRKCLLEYPYNEQRFMEGEGVFLKIAMRYKFDYQEEILFAMRQQERNMGREIDAGLLRHMGIFEDLFAHPHFPPDKRHLHGPAKAWIHRTKGWEVIRVERRYEQGRKWLMEAIRHDRKALLDKRLLLGLAVSALPRLASDRVIDAMDGVFGRPPRPPKEFYGV
jgi:glycosyltransferase involved in cell wall biosynthesis